MHGEEVVSTSICDMCRGAGLLLSGIGPTPNVTHSTVSVGGYADISV